MKKCSTCGKEITAADAGLLAEAGEWLAAEVWKDAGELCPGCLKTRGELAMMYLHEYNT